MTMQAIIPENVHVNRLVDDYTRKLYTRYDHMFAALLIAQLFGGIIVALYISPRAWAGSTSQIHPHVWASIFLGAAIISLPLYFIYTRPSESITRQTIAVAQMLWSGLFIHLSGGRIESHFHIFGSLAFLACYRDCRVLITASVVVALDHVLRGNFWTESIFGVASVQPWRWVEHIGWVAFEDIFLIGNCVLGARGIHALAYRQAQLEGANSAIEIEVDRRTAELRASQIELSRAKDAAESASRIKSEFVANMGHEIRTPMTAILGFAEMLLSPGISEEDRQGHVQVIRRNGEYLLGILNDILDLSKIESGNLRIEKVACNAPTVVADVVALLSPRASGKNLKLDLRVEGPLPCTIKTDPVRLRQILLNLIGNAIKFTSRGGVVVTLRLAHGPRDAKLQIEIADTGIGIDAKQREQLFVPFTQADTSAARKYAGTGLGLSISKRVAQLLGGDIALISTPGAGSTFVVTLATGSLDGVEMTTSPVLESTPIDIDTNTLVLHGARVLLAEDGPDNQALITHVLRNLGATVDVVMDGKTAFETALAAQQANQLYDVILMDMEMPIMDGYAATAKLRSNGYRHPIIALTAHSHSADREKCLAAGCDDFATKPIDRKLLTGIVHSWWGRDIARVAS